MSEQRPPEELIPALEAFLFLYGEAAPLSRIAKALHAEEPAVREAAELLRGELEGTGRGLFLVADAEKLQLATKPAFRAQIEELIREELREELTPASTEALALVAYAGPIARAEIDYIRGVNSSFTVRALLIRGLVDRFPDPERSHAYLYRASFAFLRHLGLPRAMDLPNYAAIRAVLDELRSKQPVAEPEPPHAS